MNATARSLHSGPAARLPSIHQRLSRTLVLISLIWGIAVSTVVWLTVRHEVDELLDNTLHESAEILYGLLSSNLARLPVESGGPMPPPVHDERTVWQIVGAANDVRLRSQHAPPQPLAVQRSVGLSSFGEEWRVFGIPFEAGGNMLYVAQPGRERREARIEAAGLTSCAALVVGLLCAVWLRSRVRRELEPVIDMSEAVTAFDPLDAGSRLAAATRAELVPMRDAIHGLGARLAHRMANERTFAAHAAHALRTPLAGMVAQLAVAQRKAPPEVQVHLKRTREAADRLRRVVTALLTLFRTGDDVDWQPVDLTDLLAQLPFETLSVTTDARERVAGDPDLIAAAMMNLLDNSARHGAAAATVSAHVTPEGARIVVRDDGVGLAEPLRLRLQAALDAQAYDGQTGLGLMLADLVARAHGGHLRLVQAPGGCVVEIVLGMPAGAAAGRSQPSHVSSRAAAPSMERTIAFVEVSRDDLASRTP
jgi:signal transduction histidine kinase